MHSRLTAVRLVAVAVLVLMPSIAAHARYHHVPWTRNMPSLQYINIAPLPGAGIALNSTGDPDGQGAMQVNIPVAYTPRLGYISVSAYKGSHDSMSTGGETDNGSGVFALGFFNYPAIYASGMWVSSVLSESKALNFQGSVLRESDKLPALSIGVQDLLEKEADMQSIYFVATKTFKAGDRRLFATAGYGGGRFLDRPFAGLSMPLNDYFNAAAEWDGYQPNVGVGWRPGGRSGWFTALAAYNGKTGWLFGGAMAIKL